MTEVTMKEANEIKLAVQKGLLGFTDLGSEIVKKFGDQFKKVLEESNKNANLARVGIQAEGHNSLKI